MATYVLIHGAWHDGSAWEAVAAAITREGHDVHAPTLAGHGADADPAATHDDCVRSVVDHLTAHDLSDVILVGHSWGGTVVARVAEEVPDRLKRLVFHNAFIPAPGTSLLDDVPSHFRDYFRHLADESGDDTITLPFDLWRNHYINDAPLELARSKYVQLHPEPFSMFTQEFGLGRFYAVEIPKSYVYANEDCSLPMGDQWGWHPHMSSRLGAYRFHQLPGSHEVLFTNPALLSRKIVEAGRD